MVATSTIPAALDAAVTIIRAAFGTTTLDVFDGQPTAGDNDDYVCVGFDPLDPMNSVEADQVPASLGNRAREESYQILCSLASASGSSSMSQRRVRAMQMFGVIESAIRANVTLNSTVRSAQVGTYTLVQEQTDTLTSAGLRFRIVCSARLT